MLEFKTKEEFLIWINDSAHRQPAAIQNVDLSSEASTLRAHEFPDSIFLECNLDDATAGHVVATGGVVIPRLEGYRFQVHRGRLYSVDELFAGFEINNPGGYKETYDYLVYKQYLEHGKDKPLFHRYQSCQATPRSLDYRGPGGSN